jgi:hypothetical protein
MQITLKDRQFVIDRAELSAAISDPYWSEKYNPTGDRRLTWFLEIAGTPVPGNDMWEVLVYKNNLHFPIRHWKDVARQVVEWTEVVDDEFGEPNGNVYMLEHEGISHARLRFGERDGIRFRVEWEGTCDVLWSEEYDRDLPFSLTGWATFTGVMVNGSERDDEQSLHQRLAAYLELSDFKPGPLCRDGHYNSGVGMAHMMFTPIE